MTDGKVPVTVKIFLILIHITHVVIGDFRFISNYKLQKLYSKGLYYCKNNTNDYKKCKDSIKTLLLCS